MSKKHAFLVLPLLSVLSLSPHELGGINREIASEIKPAKEEVSVQVVVEEKTEILIAEKPQKEEEKKDVTATEGPVKEAVSSEVKKEEEEVKEEVKEEVVAVSEEDKKEKEDKKEETSVTEEDEKVAVTDEEEKKKEEDDKEHKEELCEHPAHKAINDQVQLLITQQQGITAQMNQMQQMMQLQKMELEWKMLTASVNNLSAFQQPQMQYPAYNPYQYQQPIIQSLPGSYTPYQQPQTGYMGMGFNGQNPYSQYLPQASLMGMGMGPQYDPRMQIRPYQTGNFGIDDIGYNLGAATQQMGGMGQAPQTSNYSFTM